MVEATRRGFLQGLLGTLVIAQVPLGVADPLDPLVEPIDPFSIRPPDGITYQWVRSALLGEPDPENVQKRLDNGWQFVAPEAHIGAPTCTLGRTIEESGLVLMEKPTLDVQLDQARQRAPHMDADHRVLSMLREELITAGERIAPKLKHIGYTEADILHFTQRRLAVSLDDLLA